MRVGRFGFPGRQLIEDSGPLKDGRARHWTTPDPDRPDGEVCPSLCSLAPWLPGMTGLGRHTKSVREAMRCMNAVLVAGAGKTLAWTTSGPNGEAASVNGQRDRKATRHKPTLNAHAMMSWQCFLILKTAARYGPAREGQMHGESTRTKVCVASSTTRDWPKESGETQVPPSDELMLCGQGVGVP
ncbi:hypothetical protein N658DRAFT_494531 [Parathielavia hyrcaniae]|uniref:Uncharacterized protein n=1 Tax=Parathielavia hyrcaniae TaxID=113614 RepID=A0AAN6Q430_9PEZI|nr:hypothetical protein N658DRAFT_494531 [Parathielavia hyrcaniae]